MNLAKNMDGTEQQSANMLAKDKAKDPNGFKAVFTTPKSAYDADGFFNTKTPEAFVPYMNLDQARTAIVTTPAKAVELLQMNNQLESPYQVKGAYLIWEPRYAILSYQIKLVAWLTGYLSMDKG